MNDMLRGHQMVLVHSKTNFELPTMGVKEFEPNHSWLEQKQIQSVLDQRKALLEEQRVDKWNSLMTARWDPERRKAAVTRTGKHWEAFGHHSDHTDWLFPEEALFLLETNCLECLYGQVPVSVQRGYSLFLRPENGCCLSEYRVFAHLCREGYRVLRHLPDLTVTAYERTIRLDQHLTQRKTYGSEDDSHLKPAGHPKVLQKNAKKLTRRNLLKRLRSIKNVLKSMPPTKCERNMAKPLMSWSFNRKRSVRKISVMNFQKRLKLSKLKYQRSTNDGNKRLKHNIRYVSPGPEVPSERWQPPVVIADLPEDIEMTIRSRPAEQQGAVEIITISDSSCEENQESEEEESDSDIEIIHETGLFGEPPPYTGNEEDGFDIIEVPIPKKEIILETLSSDSEKEEEEAHDESGSESNQSSNGNWKRNRSEKITRFARRSTMSHFTFAAVDEFCADKKTKLKGTTESSSSSNSFDGSRSRKNRPAFCLEKTRNEILDMMPTMAGQNCKLMTLDSPDLQLIPDNIIPKQRSYTYSTNVLRARVFRQGFRGRRHFHGPRFTSFNPYYNNINGNVYPNQLSVGRPQEMFLPPQLSQVIGSGDINTVAMGVMQFASALLMNLPQNNINNRLHPSNTRPHFPPINHNFSQIEPPNPSRHLFNTPQQNNNFENLFDIAPQRTHLRFGSNTSSPRIEINQNSVMNLSRNSGAESGFNSGEHNFTPPIRNSHAGGNHFRNNRATHFRGNSGRGRVDRKIQRKRGAFSQTNISRPVTSNHSRSIDPAYLKPDVPITGSESNSDFIPINSSTSNGRSVEIISIDDSSDNLIPGRGIRSRLQKKQVYKRKLKRLKQKAKRMCLNQSIENNQGPDPEIVFLDSPTVNEPRLDSTSTSVKRENETEVQVKTETENVTVKQEDNEAPSLSSVKHELVEEPTVKVENEEMRVKSEKSNEESSGVRVKVEQEQSGQNLRVEIKIESSSDTSSVVSLPLVNSVKEERSLSVKSEPASEDSVAVKIEDVQVVSSLKTENCSDVRGSKEEILRSTNSQSTSSDVRGSKEEILRSTNSQITNSDAQMSEVISRERLEMGSTGVVDNECERTKQSAYVSAVRTKGDSVIETEVGYNNSNDVLSCTADRTSDKNANGSISSWAEIKTHNLPFTTFQDKDGQDSQIVTEIENEEEEETRPILQPKHCKTIGTVLSALQIFSPLNLAPGDDVRLKISFDLYLPAEFRKSHRGLPQYRIVVFSDSEPLPSPAQLREVNSRFKDGVPVLSAVVMPSSIVFYTFRDVEVPSDTTSYSQ